MANSPLFPAPHVLNANLHINTGGRCRRGKRGPVIPDDWPRGRGSQKGIYHSKRQSVRRCSGYGLTYFSPTAPSTGIDNIDIKRNKEIEALVGVYTCDVRGRDRNADPFCLYPFIAYVRFLAILSRIYPRAILSAGERACNDGRR